MQVNENSPVSKDRLDHAILRAKKIVQIGTRPNLNLSDHLWGYFTPNTLNVYYHVNFFAFEHSGIAKSVEDEGEEKAAEMLANGWLVGARVIEQGAESLLGKGHFRSIDSVFKTVDLSDLLREGLALSPQHKEYASNLYFILALDSLVNFVDFFKAAFKPRTDLKRKNLSEMSHRLTIDAMGHLLSSQASLARGMVELAIIIEQNKAFESPERTIELEEKERINGEKAIVEIERMLKSKAGRHAVDARHDQPNGSRDKQNKIREIWAGGKYRTRTACAEQEHSRLGMSYDTARKALKKTPAPRRDAT